MTNPGRIFLLCALFTFVNISNHAATYFVTNTNDSGSGSLRAAVIAANGTSGADSILFNIPDTDGGYNDTTGTWTIQLLTELPALTDDSTVINGSTQTLNKGNTNPDGPEIEITGNDIISYCFWLEGSGNLISGFVINKFNQEAILITSSNRNTISGNYIGTDVTGTSAMANMGGILVKEESKLNIIGGSMSEERNIISGNENFAVEFQNAGTDSNQVKGNYIGTDASGELPLGNVWASIYLSPFTAHNKIGGSETGEGNVISATNNSVNVYSGNGIMINESDSNTVYGNFIGTNKDGTVLLANNGTGIAINNATGNIIGGTSAGKGNIIAWNNWTGILVRSPQSINNIVAGNSVGTDMTASIKLNNADDDQISGVLLDFGANNNMIGPGNIIANNTGSGIIVSQDSTLHNTITENSIFNHTALSISNEKGGNLELTPPVISQASQNEVSGSACPGCTVEIFSTLSEEADKYEGTTTADGTGIFDWSGSTTLNFLTATATDSSGNTSQLSDAVAKQDVVDKARSTLSSDIGLEQAYPNPFILSTKIRYSISEPGYVTLKIYDIQGRVVKVLVDGYKEPGGYSTTWNGNGYSTGEVPAGIYYYKLESGSRIITRSLVLLNNFY